MKQMSLEEAQKRLSALRMQAKLEAELFGSPRDEKVIDEVIDEVIELCEVIYGGSNADNES